MSEYINVVYNNDHFEDVLGINNKVFSLKEPYKSLPTTLNNLSDVVNTKQDIFTCTSPLIKNDVSNNISIDLSAYQLKTNVDASLNNIISTKQNIFTCISPLIKNDVSNNITIDLSSYALKNALNASNVTSGTLTISRGGIGTTTLAANQILIGNTNTSILQSPNLTWNNTSNTLSVTNFIGSGNTLIGTTTNNGSKLNITASTAGDGGQITEVIVLYIFNKIVAGMVINNGRYM